LPGDGLADPPRGVGGEAEAPPHVEPLDGGHQPHVALLHEVEEGQGGGRGVALGDGHHEPEVRVHELLGGAVALLDGRLEARPLFVVELLGVVGELLGCLTSGDQGQAETLLVASSQEGVAPHIGEVQPDQLVLSCW
jgi:hypothetical protein